MAELNSLASFRGMMEMCELLVKENISRQVSGVVRCLTWLPRPSLGHVVRPNGPAW